jgi:hypothetical protein
LGKYDIPYWIALYVVLRRVFTETLCNWIAEGGENINGEQEMSVLVAILSAI